jgi:hypothetical protein
MPDFVRYFEQKKYMWDGVNYVDQAAAKQAAEAYQQQGFETRMAEDGEAVFIYTRRVAAEVVVDGEQAT